jgi:riboflavin kinase/FMN adenylyltransferase
MRGTAVAVGVFDGVHLGHREVIRLLVHEAMIRSLPSAVLTFDPHPRPHDVEGEGGLLLSPDERAALIRSLGVQWVTVLGFTPTVRAMTADRFFRDVLLAMLGARVVIVGPTHRFGAGGTGDANLLRHLGAASSVDVVAAPEWRVDGAPASSRRIRTHLASGQVAEASRVLGRFYRLDGMVVRGSGIGRELGFPTANLEVVPNRLVPAHGVYACVAHLAEGDVPAVANVGVAPTVHDESRGSRRIEVHLLDRDIALYGRRIGISFVFRVREERRFSGVDDLRRQIAIDVGRVRSVLSDRADLGLGITPGNSDPSSLR